MHIYCEVFTIIRLINTFFTSHKYHFVGGVLIVKTLKLYSHSNFLIFYQFSLYVLLYLVLKKESCGRKREENKTKTIYFINKKTRNINW